MCERRDEMKASADETQERRLLTVQMEWKLLFFFSLFFFFFGVPHKCSNAWRYGRKDDSLLFVLVPLSCLLPSTFPWQLQSNLGD